MTALPLSTAPLHEPPAGAVSISDQALLQRFAEHRDEPAFAELVARHGALVLGVCRRITRDYHDAEDAAQAVFLLLARKAPGLGGHTNLGGWLFTTARLTALRLVAATRARSRREAALGPVHKDSAEALPAPVDGDAPGSGPGERGCALDAALAALPERYRQVLVLHYLEGQSCAAIAMLLDIRPDNVAVRLSRGRRRLQVDLSRKLPAGVVLGILSGAHRFGVVGPDGLTGSAQSLVQAGAALAHAPQPAAAALVDALARAAHRALLHAATLILAGLAVAAGVIVAATRQPAAPRLQAVPVPTAGAVVAHAPPAAALAAAAPSAAAVPDPDQYLVPEPLLGGLVERMRPAWMAVLEQRLAEPMATDETDQPADAILQRWEARTGLRVQRPVLAAVAPRPAFLDARCTIHLHGRTAGDTLTCLAVLSSSALVLRDGGLFWDATSQRVPPTVWHYHLEQLLPDLPRDAAARAAALLPALPELWIVPSADSWSLHGTLLRVVSRTDYDPLSEELLRALRDRGAQAQAPASERRFRDACQRPLTQAVAGTLSDCLARLSSQTAVTIILDPADELALAGMRPVRLAAGARSLAEAVRELARQAHLEAFAAPLGSNARDGQGLMLYCTSHAAEQAGTVLLRIHDLRALGLASQGPALAARIRALDPTAQAAAWNDLLVVSASRERQMAVAALVEQLMRLPRERREQAIAHASGDFARTPARAAMAASGMGAGF